MTNPDPDDLSTWDKPRGEECAACRKRSDAAKVLAGFTLCGTHYDACLAEWKRVPRVPLEDHAALWVQRQRETTYRACWDLPAMEALK
jgi:hypothetical protein